MEKARRTKNHNKIKEILQKDGITNEVFQLLDWLDDVLKYHDFLINK